MAMAPPVMRSFVRAGRKTVKSDYSCLWSFLERIGYSLDSLEEGAPNLEELFTILQTISTGIWYNSREDYVESVGEDFARMRPIDLLLSFIIEVLDIPSASACKTPCKHHCKLFSRLQVGDTVISFNYDLIAESALREEISWDEAGGYGFSCHSRIKDLDSKGLFDTEMPCDVALLKPHGSLNWRLETDEVSALLDDDAPVHRLLRPIREELLGHKFGRRGEPRKRISLVALDDMDGRCYAGYLPVEAFELDKKFLAKMTKEEGHRFLQDGVKIHGGAFIIPPAAYKFGSMNIPPDLVEIWSHMNTAIATARKVVCIGYSFPPTDVEFGSMFRLAILKNQQADLEVEVVNPDPNICDKLTLMVPGVKVAHVATSLSSYVGGSV